jgi:hypothetical protein
MARDISKLKTSLGILCQRVAVREASILQHRKTWTIAVLCVVLDSSRHGFYAYAQQHAASQIDQAETTLLARVNAMHAESGQS